MKRRRLRKACCSPGARICSLRVKVHAAAALALALGQVSWVAFCALTVTLLGIWGVHGPLLSWPAAVLDSKNAAAGASL